MAHSEGMTFGDFLHTCFTVTESDAHPVWVEPEVLIEHEVRQWTELPLWPTHTGVWSVDSSRAVSAGLQCRPLRETITDTWAWLRADGRPVDHPRWAEHGLAPEKEAKILAALASTP